MPAPVPVARRRLLLAGAAAVAVVCAWLLWPRRPAAPPAAPTPAADERVHVGPIMARLPQPIAQPPADLPEPIEEPPPVIDEVVVEKAEVCEGEENLISVRAHTLNDTDGFMRVVINGQLGSALPVRTYLEKPGQQPMHVVQVFGRGGAVTSVEGPLFRVKDCKAPHIVVVQHRALPNAERAFHFIAEVQPSPVLAPSEAQPWRAVRYEWDFGDGTTVTTTTPEAEHTYAAYVETTAETDFLVRVDALDAAGQRLGGRDLVNIHNASFEALGKGTVLLVAELTPRFPRLDADGRVRQKVHLYHHRPEEVVVEAVERVRTGDDGVEQTGEAIAPALLLGRTVIPPGLEGVTFTVELDPGGKDRFLLDRYRVRGHAGPLAAAGEFSVMTPQRTPTPDDPPVEDPALVARILEAQRILGKQFVNDEDLWRLEREGRFAALPPRASPHDE